MFPTETVRPLVRPCPYERENPGVGHKVVSAKNENWENWEKKEENVLYIAWIGMIDDSS